MIKELSMLVIIYLSTNANLDPRLVIVFVFLHFFYFLFPFFSFEVRECIKLHENAQEHV